jgi:hypothetical protein
VLHEDGSVVELAGKGKGTNLVATATSPGKVSPDTREVTPVSRLAPGKTYELYRWDGSWKKWWEGVLGEEPPRFEQLPEDGLYWLLEKGSRKLERIFTIEGGRQRWW